MGQGISGVYAQEGVELAIDALDLIQARLEDIAR
jgi:hypothetical protein